MFAAFLGLIVIGNTNGADFSPSITNPSFVRDHPSLNSPTNSLPDNPSPDFPDGINDDDDRDDLSPAKRRLEVSEKLIPWTKDLAHDSPSRFRSSLATSGATLSSLIYLFCKLLI